MKYILCTLLVFLIGCEEVDIEKMNSVALSINERSIELNKSIDIHDLNELQLHFSSLKDGLDSDDIKIIKNQAQKIDVYLESRVWGWYVSIYEENSSGGVEAAKKKIQEITTLNDLKRYERDSLDAISEGLETELGMQDSRILESVAVQSLRSKFGDTVADVAISIVLLALFVCSHGC